MAPRTAEWLILGALAALILALLARWLR